MMMVMMMKERDKYANQVDLWTKIRIVNVKEATKNIKKRNHKLKDQTLGTKKTNSICTIRAKKKKIIE